MSASTSTRAPTVAPLVKVNSITELYEVNEVPIGKGGFSFVYSAVHKKTGELRAIKVMEKIKLAGKQATMVIRETEILRRCQHPNILKLHEVVETPKLLCLVMELVTGGDLYDFLTAKRSLTEKEAAKIAKGILQAVEYLHGANPPVVHRDIKPENVLIQDPKEGKVLLSDFGLSKILRDPSSVECTPGGTTFYIPPEIIEGLKKHGRHPRPTNVQDMKSLDLWSTGVLLYILLCGSPPWRGALNNAEECQKLLDKIHQGPQFPEDKWRGVSREAKDLVGGLLQIEPTKRYPVRVALQHPWIQTGGGGSIAQLSTPSVLASEYRDKEEFHQQVAAAVGLRPGEPAAIGTSPGVQAVLAAIQQSGALAASLPSTPSTPGTPATPLGASSPTIKRTLSKPGMSALMKNRMVRKQQEEKQQAEQERAT